MAGAGESTLGHFFLDACVQDGNRCFLRSAKGESLSFDETLCRVAQIVQTCRMIGLEKGDRVVCYSEDTFNSTLYALALSIAGIVFVPLSPQFSVHFLKSLMTQSGALVVFTSLGHFERLVEEGIDTIYLSDVAIHHVRAASPASDSFDAITVEKAREVLRDRLFRIAPEDTLMIQPTSGSTGQPKLVVRKHLSVLRYARYVGAQLTHPAGTQPRFLMIAALTHAFGFHMLATAVSMGAELIVPSRTDINGSLEEVRALDPTVLPMTPRVLRSLRTQSDRTAAPFFGPSARFLLVAGGTPLPDDLRSARNQGVEVITFYGSTEASLLALTPRGAWREGYAGRIAPDVEMKVSDEKELLVRSPGQMLEYLNNDLLTREAYTSDGFYRTGDLGEIDADGYVRILGRKNDAYITPEGSYVYPERIEILIESLPWVSQAIVVGDRLPYLAALIVVNENSLAEASRSLRSNDPFSTLREVAARNLLQINSRLERIERIARFCLLTHPFDAALYHVVGSGKVCRERLKIAQFHRMELNCLYGPENTHAHIVVPNVDHLHCEHPSTDLRIHLVLTFKRYASGVTQEVKRCLRQSIDDACADVDAKILAEDVKHDHVHLIITYPAARAVAEIVEKIRNQSAKSIFEILLPCRDCASDEGFFDSQYLAVSSGAISDEMIQNYVDP